MQDTSEPEQPESPELVQMRKRLRRAMKTRGITQPQLAQEIGIGQGTLSSWLSGRYGLSVSALLTLAQTITRLAPDHPPVVAAQLLAADDATPPTNDDE